MAVLIKDEEADRLIRELAARTGETITDAVKNAVAQRLKSMPLSDEAKSERLRRMDAVLAKLDAIPTVDHRSHEQVLGYNERGCFD